MPRGMTTSLQDRTIAMILTVPHMKELTRTGEDLPPENPRPPSIPVYHASIIKIEPHQDDQNISDLIVRVPNFHHVSIPSVTVTINEGESSETPHTKRRAPTCPITNGTFVQTKINESETINHAKRLALGLRNLRRAIITNCKVKRPMNINPTPIVPVFPDVEIITENFEPLISEKKTKKTSSSASKPFRPKILFLKRKKYNLNKKRAASSNSADTQTDYDENRTNENSQDDEMQPEEKKKHYSFIDPENRELITDAEASENDSIPKTFISTAKINLITGHRDHDETQGEVLIVDPNDDTFSECYEVAFEFDPEFQRYREQVYLPAAQDQPSIADLPSEINPWISITHRNEYEQPDRSFEPSRTKIQPIETTDLDQIPIDRPEIFPTDPSMTNEDYTVILQFLKYALEIESIPDADCDEFNKQIKELFRTE